MEKMANQWRGVLACVMAAVALQVMGADEWELGSFTTRNGNIVTVDIPTNRPSCGAAKMRYDFSRFHGEGFEASIRARGFNLTTPKECWLGFKFMGSYADPKTGERYWPGAPHKPGTWDWQTVRFTDMNMCGRGPGEITLGLQNGGGRVEFDLSTLKFRVLPPLWPSTNLTHRCVYSPRVKAWPIHKGVMLGHGLKEADFKVLHDWGVTLARFQMTRGWNTPGANRDLEDYGKYIDGCLDDLENHLVWARKYGIRIVVDLHAAPGARDEHHDEYMFHNTVYADAFIATWRKIATRFRGRDEIFGFDLINEPQQRSEALPGCDYWTLQSRAAEAIRAIDPETPIIIESNLYDAPQAFAYLHPLALTNIIYQAHMYVPMEFTHQGVFDGNAPATVYPDAQKGWDIDFLRKTLKPVVDFQKRHGARVYLGEFSAIVWGEGADAYIRDCITVFRENGWDWTYHAFREWSGWSVEHAAENRWKMVPSADNPRKRALLAGFRGEPLR